MGLRLSNNGPGGRLRIFNDTVVRTQGRLSITVPGFIPSIPLLDLYPNAAAAYSLRKLRSDYLGAAIRVRRTNGDEVDIGFLGDGTLDTITLANFCSGVDGFVTTWYDQSGNARNATQSTAANQPQIVSSGSVIVDNVKPSILFDGVNDKLTKSSFGFPTNNISVISVNSRITNYSFLSIGYDTTAGFINNNGSTRIGFDGRPNGGAYTFAASSISATTNQVLQFNVYDRVNLRASTNNTPFVNQGVSTSSIIYGNQNFEIGYANSNCYQSEIIIYPTDQSSNLNGINSIINDFYNIYS